MSVLNGGLTLRRFAVDGPKVLMILESHLTRLAEFSTSQSKVYHSGALLSWGAGSHVKDADFRFGKNALEGMIMMQMIVSINRIPAELKKQFYETDLAALSKNNPSGHPSAMNKREAKQSAENRIQELAKDGRWLRRAAVDVAWDTQTNEAYLCSASRSVATGLRILFKATFGCDLIPIDINHRLRARWSEEQLADLKPSRFVRLSGDDVAWCLSHADCSYIGNEMLMWLWYQCEDESATINLLDQSEVTVFMSKRLMLDCPLGRSGSETINHEGPTRLPEALRAIQSGKLPRRAGITMVHCDQHFEMVIDPEELVITSAKLPPCDDKENKNADRIGQVRGLRNLVDLLIDTFLDLRMGEDWPDQRQRITRWLERE
jgi:hypothetical protein